MEIPLHKIHQIRNLLYDNTPSYFNDIKNDEQLRRIINEVIEILNTD